MIVQVVKNVNFFLLQSSATTNETTIHGSDIAAALKIMYPSIQDAELKALIAVCSPILRANISMLILLFRPIHYQLLLPPRFSSKLLQET